MTHWAGMTLKRMITGSIKYTLAFALTLETRASINIAKIIDNFVYSSYNIAMNNFNDISDFRGKTVLITGGAGFIGYHLSKVLLMYTRAKVIIVDSITDYYEVGLKDSRLADLKKCAGQISPKNNENGDSLTFIKGDIANEETVNDIFKKYHPNIIVNLAAQAGVRYSIDNPRAYINSNIIGFFNILEAARHFGCEHLVFASSSSVYGGNKNFPFCETDKVDNPVSLYAATKKSDELMAYAYCKLYGIKATGLRFFTVYGPYGRPDMAYFKFTNLMRAGQPIALYNNGDLYRDFTYIDDIVKGVICVMQKTPVALDDVFYKIYNIGNNKCESLMHFTETLENCLIKEGIITEPAKKEYLPMQPGDVYKTYADVSNLEKDFGYRPVTTIEEGLAKFAKWYKEYYL